MIIPSIGMGPLGPAEWSVGGVPGVTGVGVTNPAAPGGLAGAAGSPAGGAASFSGVLTNAISSLEGSQNSAAAASQALATGTAANPTQAVTAVENAALSMDFASQMRNQLDQSVQTLFQTQM